MFCSIGSQLGIAAKGFPDPRRIQRDGFCGEESIALENVPHVWVPLDHKFDIRDILIRIDPDRFEVLRLHRAGHVRDAAGEDLRVASSAQDLLTVHPLDDSAEIERFLRIVADVQVDLVRIVCTS